MALKRATNSIQSQLLLEMGVPINTADAYYSSGGNRLLFIPRYMNGDLFGSHVAWTVDALIDYLCDGCKAYVQFSRAPWDGFWICCYTRNDGETKVTVSKVGPTKIDAIFEVIYELKRSKYDTGTEKEG